MKIRFLTLVIGTVIALGPRYAFAQTAVTSGGGNGASGSGVSGSGVSGSGAAGGASALTPTPAPLPSNAQLLADLTQAETRNDGGLLVYSYGQAVRDPVLAGTTLSHLMTEYYHLRGQSITATQATQAVNEALLRFALLQAAQNELAVQQNQRIIEQNDQLQKQNQRIIALLEIIAKK